MKRNVQTNQLSPPLFFSFYEEAMQKRRRKMDETIKINEYKRILKGRMTTPNY